MVIFAVIINKSVAIFFVHTLWTSGKKIARLWEHEDRRKTHFPEKRSGKPIQRAIRWRLRHRMRPPRALLSASLPSHVCCAALESCSRRSSARGLLSPCMVHPLVGFSVGDLFCCVRCAPTRQAAQHDFFYGARLLRDLLSFQVACAMYVYQCAIAARRPCPAGQQAYRCWSANVGA